jgi:hypothetical protein
MNDDEINKMRTMSVPVRGITTVIIDNEVKSIHDLNPVQLSVEWAKIVREKQELLSINQKYSRGFRGFALKLLGVTLPHVERGSIQIGSLDQVKSALK